MKAETGASRNGKGSFRQEESSALMRTEATREEGNSVIPDAAENRSAEPASQAGTSAALNLLHRPEPSLRAE